MIEDELADGARRRLLALARQAIEEWLDGSRLPPFAGGGIGWMTQVDSTQADATLRQPRGAFVSLTRRADGALRGCVGFVEPQYPLFEAVARAAVAAASTDGRFPPVDRSELSSLRVQVSALSPVAAIAPDLVQAGLHGLIVRCQGRGGLLLPQVAAELGWGREELLEGACRKAGLPARTWQRPDAVILAFTAQVFGEDE